MNLSRNSTFLFDLFNLREEAELSYYFDLSVIQDSFRYRALHRARAISQQLVTDKGEIDKEFLHRIVMELKNNGYAFYPDGLNDGVITEHMLRFLTHLLHEEALLKSLKRFQKPLCHRWAARLVMDTLGKYRAHDPTDAQICRAVLCACLTPLRQSIGSCFASSPAILVQKEQVELLLDDLHQVLTLGKLKRTFGGREYSVPLSPHIGYGDLRKNLFHLDPKAMSWFSPGLIAACELLEIIPARISFSEKLRILKEKIHGKEGKRKISAEDLLYDLLLHQMGLHPQDLQSAEEIERMQLKMARASGFALETSASKKVEQLAQFNKCFSEAKAAFSGMCDNALLKAWEFTLASFIDVKWEFSRWNLYHSLGFAKEEPGGIGELIYSYVDEKLQKTNAKLENFDQEYKAAFDAAKATEALLRQAGSESEARRLQAEYQARAYHMHSCLQIRDTLYNEASHYSMLFAFLLEKYDALFPEYFQEIYDPQMIDAPAVLHDDSLAGFRLVYKYGRTDPYAWTLIYKKEEFVDCLIDFFSTTESRIAAEAHWEGARNEISHITTELLSHVRSEAFIQSAKERTGKMPSEKPNTKREPWAYTSGGNVTTLLKTYFCRESEYTYEQKWVENESELLIFLTDALKNLMPRTLDPFLTEPDKRMLMTSPTHAFLLLPGQHTLSEGWKDNGFTYTWVRDHVIVPGQKFYADMSLSTTKQIFLLDAFCKELPPDLNETLYERVHFDHHSISITTFRSTVLETLISTTVAYHPSQRRPLSDALDAFLFQALPIVAGNEWKTYARRLLSDLYDDPCKELFYTLSEAPSAYMTAKKIKELSKAVYMQSRASLFLPFDIHQYIADHARFIGLAPPTSLIVADTNWPNQYFGFIVNPGTGQLELWSLDRTCSQGIPMSEWKPFLDGTQRQPWTLYVNPGEYTFK